ncbi:MAG: ThuA domain-containing protein, partial [Phycisphaerales bacterium]|nr:ThuA domain-containing protein [Phycisphaerales bacterium]
HYEKTGRTDRFPLNQPVSWIMEAEPVSSGVPERVFFSTTAHPYDFREPSMRRHALNGILWAVGREDLIPEDGARAEVVGTYDPTPAGFGTVYRQGVRPGKVGEGKHTYGTQSEAPSQ